MSLAPKLKEIQVSPDDLCLDPNNPRLFSKEDNRISLKQVHLPGYQSAVSANLKTENDQFRIGDLKNSIIANGYVPELAGYIFVRKLPDLNQYLVLEGNRRVMAIRAILQDRSTQTENRELIESLQQISVKEIVDNVSEKKLQEKISYLLGTLHQGSSEEWSPFAQARGIYNRYMQLSKQKEGEFIYQDDVGRRVASLLSISEKEIKERLCVYRAMQQLAADPVIARRKDGGIIRKYYSLVKDAIYHNKLPLKYYLPSDPNTFELEQVTIDRLDKLCNFNGTIDRKHDDGSAPAANNPKQWNYLNKILSDDNVEKKDRNLNLVEEQRMHPDDVWAARYAEIVEIGWKDWLEQVYGILMMVPMGETMGESAVEGLRRLNQVLHDLTALEVVEGVKLGLEVAAELEEES